MNNTVTMGQATTSGAWLKPIKWLGHKFISLAKAINESTWETPQTIETQRRLEELKAKYSYHTMTL